MTQTAAGRRADPPDQHPKAHPGVYDLADLARLFRRRPMTMVHVVRGWTKHRGFPPRLPGRRPLWSQRLVDMWIASPDAQTPIGEPPIPAGEAADAPAGDGHAGGGDTDPVRERRVLLQRRVLEARYG